MARRPRLFFDIAAEDRTGQAFSALHRRLSESERRLQATRREFVAVTGAVVAFGAAVGAAALRGARQIDESAKAARRLDTSIGGFRALELAADEAGVPLSALTNDLQSIQREMANIGVSGNADRALRRLGMSAADIADLDTPDQIAAIADRVQELGLSSGEATALLRDLGVRNREMVLLMAQGGDAIRRAQRDIEDYGLAIDAVDARRIEQANDAIGRLGLITQYAGQRLAMELVPAMGRLAEAMTDSLRVGGALRMMIDGLADNLSVLAATAGVAVTVFGVRYVGALVVARGVTVAFTGAVIAMRTALMRTGVGALIIGAGYLVDLLIRLRSVTGSWADALSELGDVALGVWQGITVSAQAIQPALAAVWAGIKVDFFDMLADIVDAWQDALRGFGANLQMLEMAPGIGGTLGMIGRRLQVLQGGDALRGRATRAHSDQLIAEFERDQIVAAGFDRAREALARLNEVLDQNGDMTTEAADAARRLAAEIDGIGGEGGRGGGGAAAAAEGMSALTEETARFGEAAKQVESAFESTFVNFVSGAQSARQAIEGLLRDLARLWAQAAFRSIFGGAFEAGGALSFLIPGRAAGGPVAAGQPYMVGERGPELFLPSQSGSIVPNHKLGGGQREPVQVVISMQPSGEFDARVAQTAGAVVSVEGPRVVRDEIGSGRLDGPMGGRFGAKPQRRLR